MTAPAPVLSALPPLPPTCINAASLKAFQSMRPLLLMGSPFRKPARNIRFHYTQQIAASGEHRQSGIEMRVMQRDYRRE